MSEGGYSNPIVGGAGALVRDQIQSRNYVAGVSGWIIEADGDAEFNDLIARGNFCTGGAGARVCIPDAVTSAQIDFYTGDGVEVTPATILVPGTGAGNLGRMELVTPDIGQGVGTLYLFAPDDGLPANLSWAGPVGQIANAQFEGDVFISRDLYVSDDVQVTENVDILRKITAGNLDYGSGTTNAAAGMQTKAVNFTTAFANLPGTAYVMAIPDSGAAAGVINEHMVNAVTGSGFTFRVNRSNNTATTFLWFAIKA